MKEIVKVEKTSRLKLYKRLLVVFFVIAVLEGVYIYMVSDLSNTVSLPMYSFYDSMDNGKDVLVTAEGSWISSQTDLAFPLSTLNIECWREYGYCWVADATVMKFGSDILSSGLELYEIQYWNDDFIETKPSIPLMGCVEEFYRLDRRSKTVSYVRRTINNTTSMCEGIQDEPVTATLGDGYKRLRHYRDNK